MQHEQLFRVARESLERNIVHFPISGGGLTAGQGQFEALWTRDFCFAALGLLALRRHTVVRDHLSRLLSMRRASDDLIPRLVDSVSPGWLRVLHFTAGKVLRGRLKRLPLQEPFSPEYENEHGTASIDSNLLTVLTASRYLESSGDFEWWQRCEPELVRVFRYYDARFADGLIVQPPYSDWQDSVRRAGKTLYTNLLYYLTAKRLLDYPAFGVSHERLALMHHAIFDAFFDSQTGLLRSLERGPQISIDGNLLALNDGFFDHANHHGPDSHSVYTALRRHPLWPSAPRVPGFVTYPNYPDRSVSLQVKLVGLGRYHDALFWSWLAALAARVAVKCGDGQEASRIFERLEELACRDGTVYEVYRAAPPYDPWRSWLYSSESAFSWGAGTIVAALDTYHHHLYCHSARP